MLLFFLITLTSAYTAVSSEPCVTKSPCRCINSKNQAIDLSSVGLQNFPRFYQVAYKDDCDGQNITKLYSYNPCFLFDSNKHVQVPAGHAPCIGAAACVRTTGPPDGEEAEEYMIGFQNSAEWFQNGESEQVAIKYTVPESKWSLIVDLHCDNSSTKNVLEMVSCVKDTYQIIMKLTTECACWNGCSLSVNPGGSSTGLSVGSKLLIAFFTILLAYIIVGMVWNYCNGSRGVELIPNVEFWNDLPTLIMEGVSFVCSCCGRQSSYGEV